MSVRKLKSSLIQGLLAVGFGLLLLGLVEVALRLAGYQDVPFYVPPKLAFVVKNGKIAAELPIYPGPWFEPEPLPDGTSGFRTAPNNRGNQRSGVPGSMRDVHFAAHPPPGVTRYFLIGGSAALGLAPAASGGQRDDEARTLPQAVIPTEKNAAGLGMLPEQMAISGALRSRLGQAGHRAEVINASMVAADSGLLVNIARATLTHHPRGLLLYLGNNEDIPLQQALEDEEIPPVFTAGRQALRGSRLYRLLADIIFRVTSATLPPPPPPPPGRDMRKLGEITMAQWNTAGHALISGGTPEDDVYRALIARFRSNLARIVGMAEAAGVDVYVIPAPPKLTVPPMFSACSPHSEHLAKRRHGLANRANAARMAGDLERAAALARECLEVDQFFALCHHELGMALTESGSTESGLRELETALTLDLSRRRSLPGFASVAEALCRTRRCQAFDAHHALMEQARVEGLDIYFQLFGDHEHLTPEGCAWVAQRFAQMIDRDHAPRSHTREPALHE